MHFFFLFLLFTGQWLIFCSGKKNELLELDGALCISCKGVCIWWQVITIYMLGGRIWLSLQIIIQNKSKFKVGILALYECFAKHFFFQISIVCSGSVQRRGICYTFEEDNSFTSIFISILNSKKKIKAFLITTWIILYKNHKIVLSFQLFFLCWNFCQHKNKHNWERTWRKCHWIKFLFCFFSDKFLLQDKKIKEETKNNRKRL